MVMNTLGTPVGGQGRKEEKGTGAGTQGKGLEEEPKTGAGKIGRGFGGEDKEREREKRVDT